MLLHAGHFSVGLKHEKFMQEAKRTEKAEKAEMSDAPSPFHHKPHYING